MDQERRNSVGNIFLIIFVVLYVISLVNVAMISPNNTFRGWEVLLIGGFQSFLGFLGIGAAIKSFSLEMFFTFLPVPLPWLANISMFASGIATYKFSIMMGRIFAFISVLFAGVFFIYPVALIDNEVSLVSVQPKAGAYFWLFSSVILLLASIIKVIPSKK